MWLVRMRYVDGVFRFARLMNHDQVQTVRKIGIP